MAQQFIALALAEDPGLVPSTHMAAHPLVTPVFRRFDSLL